VDWFTAGAPGFVLVVAMLGSSRNFLIVRSDHLCRPRASLAPKSEERCGTGIALSIANLVLSDDVSLALNVNHSARIRCHVSACPSDGKPCDSKKQ
jgi:hypothetical protein